MQGTFAFRKSFFFFSASRLVAYDIDHFSLFFRFFFLSAILRSSSTWKATEGLISEGHTEPDAHCRRNKVAEHGGLQHGRSYIGPIHPSLSLSLSRSLRLLCSFFLIKLHTLVLHIPSYTLFVSVYAPVLWMARPRRTSRKRRRGCAFRASGVHASTPSTPVNLSISNEVS